MVLKVAELLNLLIAVLVGGMYWGPWLGLTISINTFEVKTFLAIVRRLNQNMAPLMTILSPPSLLTTILVLPRTYPQPAKFYFNLAALIAFRSAVIVSVLTE